MNIEEKIKLANKHKLNLDIRDLNKVEFIFTDNKRNTLAVEGTIVRFREPIYLAEGIRLCPLCPVIGVTSNGKVYAASTLRLLTVSPIDRNKEYPYIRIPRYLGFNRSKLNLHRAVASAWVENNAPLITFIVNHKNGNKNDCTSSNLEWCTYKDNSRHAFDNQLNITTTDCECLDIVSGEIKKFPSLVKLAKYLDIPETRVYHYLTKKHNPGLIKNRYEIRNLNEKREWFHKVIGQVKPSSKYEITVTDTSGKESIFWNLIDFDLKFNGYSCLRGIEFILEKAKRKHPELKFMYSLRNAVYIFQIKDINTNEVFEITSFTELGNIINRSRSYIDGLIKSRRVCQIDNYLVRLKTDEEWLKPSSICPRSIKAKVTNLSNGLEVIFNRLEDISNELKMSIPTIRKKLNEGADFRGYRFKIIEEYYK